MKLRLPVVILPLAVALGLFLLGDHATRRTVEVIKTPTPKVINR